MMGANCLEVEWAMACGVSSLRSAFSDEEASGEEGKWGRGVAWVLKGRSGGLACCQVHLPAIGGDGRWLQRAATSTEEVAGGEFRGERRWDASRQG